MTHNYKIVRVPGLRLSPRRGVALLDSDTDSRVNAATMFAAMLADTTQIDRVRELRTRFDHWIDGVQHNDRWYHGFKSSDYRECLVFKWKDVNVGQRLYGFLHHPLPKTNRRFLLCVLTNHAEKPLAQWETDTSELVIANALRLDGAALAAVAVEYLDQPPGAKQWPN